MCYTYATHNTAVVYATATSSPCRQHTGSWSNSVYVWQMISSGFCTSVVRPCVTATCSVQLHQRWLPPTAAKANEASAETVCMECRCRQVTLQRQAWRGPSMGWGPRWGGWRPSSPLPSSASLTRQTRPMLPVSGKAAMSSILFSLL